jgi:methionine sulfoxide reductase heme-binding subunit
MVQARGPTSVRSRPPTYHAKRIVLEPSFVHAPQRASGTTAVVWSIRCLIAAPFVLMGPEVVAAIRHRPDAVQHISASTADVLGTSSFLLLTLMLTITPIHTLTGRRWHLVLRRDLGLGMFAVATTDLLLAATTTGDTFPGGFAARVGGHTFLAVGTIATLLLVPLAATATKRAKSWLGKHWKTVHRITYVVWALILLHLALLFALRSFFIDALLVSAPLFLLRVGSVRRWFVVNRQRGTRFWTRLAVSIVLIAIFAAGITPFVRELAAKGGAAFVQRPVDD